MQNFPILNQYGTLTSETFVLTDNWIDKWTMIINIVRVETQ